MQELHVLLATQPGNADIENMLAILGFEYRESITSTNANEPSHERYEWLDKNLSGAGLTLRYFDGIFLDSRYAEKFRVFVSIEAPLDCSEVDVAMVDITANLLMRRYGGTLHNTGRLDRKVPNVYLCGKNNYKS